MKYDSEIAELSRRVDFSSLDGKSILITGGSGFVGNWLIQGLYAATIFQHRKFTFCALDHTAFDRWMYDTPQHFDYIFHLAPVYDRFVREKLLSCNPRRIVYASSGAVYLPNMSDYGRGKIDAENSLLSSGMDVRIARLFTFCGPYLRPGNFAVGNFVKNAIENKPLEVWGDGSAVRSYMYGADLAVWLWQIMLNGETGRVYNVGSEKPISILKLAERVKQVINPDAEIRVMNDGFVERAPYYVPDTAATRSELGVIESYFLEHQLIRYAEWISEGK